MELIVISNPVLIPNEAQVINDLFSLGLKYFHLRKPLCGPNQTRQLLKKINPEYLGAIAMHQHHDVALEFGIKRLHYTESARNGSNEQWQKHVQNGVTLSTSIHTLEALPGLKQFSYVFFGPVFNSISKKGYSSVVQNDFRLSKENEFPKVIALGGITINNIAITREMRFDGAAILGAVWNEDGKAIENFKKINYIYQKTLDYD